MNNKENKVTNLSSLGEGKGVGPIGIASDHAALP